MKKQTIFYGIIFVGLSLFLLLNEFQLPLASKLYSWPSILLLIGLALIVQAYKSRDFQTMLPGMLLLTLGTHFHAVLLFPYWPKHIGMVLFMVAISFLFSYRQNKHIVWQGLFLFILAALMMFSGQFRTWTSLLEQNFSEMWKFWPLLLLITGLYLLFFKRK